MKKINIDELHALLLDEAKMFHQLCKRNNIPYYMLGGTMLGAVRHKDIIPWDDDMDFGIPRQFYDKFVDIAQKELPQPYRILTYKNSEYACMGIGKIDNENTVCTEIYSVSSTEQLGVFLDIFPLDYTNGKSGFFSYNSYCRALFKFQKLLIMDDKKRPVLKRFIARIAKTIFRINRCRIPAYLDKIMLQHKSSRSHVFNLSGAWGMKELIPAEIFGKPTLYKFNDTHFYGVENADAYLRHLYGNYMQLPPVEKRHIHSIECYYKENNE